MLNPSPNHVALIMDGNRRWAEKCGLPATAGHMQGSSIIEAIVSHAWNRGVHWLSLFAFSTENWNRPAQEIDGIFGVFRYFLDRKAQTLVDKNVRLRTVGTLQGFPVALRESIEDLVKKSSSNTGLNLTVAINYGGLGDITNAVRKLTDDLNEKKITRQDIDEARIKSSLATSELPPIDLLIRTGNEMRLSNFMLWDLAYSELVFSPVMWPEFSTGDFDSALEDYTNRDRRFGSGWKKDVKRSDVAG